MQTSTNFYKLYKYKTVKLNGTESQSTEMKMKYNPDISTEPSVSSPTPLISMIIKQIYVSNVNIYVHYIFPNLIRLATTKLSHLMLCEIRDEAEKKTKII